MLPSETLVLPCVRVEHLSVSQKPGDAVRSVSKRTGSTRVQVQVHGVRAHRRVNGDRNEIESTRAMLREQLGSAAPSDREATRWTVDDLLGRYLTYLENQGKERRTLTRYKSVAKVWISPAIGNTLARRLSADDVDRCFARMRKGGQSASSMNQGKALLSGAFKWARRTGKVLYNLMIDFQLPKSTFVRSEKLPPEVEDISVILNAAWQHTPDIAPILTLAATTGARLSELVVPRQSDINWDRGTLRVQSAADEDGSIKETKRAEHRREVPLDVMSLLAGRTGGSRPGSTRVYRLSSSNRPILTKSQTSRDWRRCVVECPSVFDDDSWWIRLSTTEGSPVRPGDVQLARRRGYE
jgi:integrase